MRIRWILYRGPGKVQFDPDLSPYVYGKPLTSETQVSFSVPGDYRIRAIATDGALFSTYDVDVKVNPGNQVLSYLMVKTLRSKIRKDLAEQNGYSPANS